MTDERDDERAAETMRSELRVMARRPAATTGWQAADTVRRAVVMRRRRRWSVAAGVVLVGAVATALSLTVGGSTGSPQAASDRSGKPIDGAVQLLAHSAPVAHVPSADGDQVAA